MKKANKIKYGGNASVDAPQAMTIDPGAPIQTGDKQMEATAEALSNTSWHKTSQHTSKVNKNRNNLNRMRTGGVCKR